MQVTVELTEEQKAELGKQCVREITADEAVKCLSKETSETILSAILLILRNKSETSSSRLAVYNRHFAKIQALLTLFGGDEC